MVCKKRKGKEGREKGREEGRKGGRKMKGVFICVVRKERRQGGRGRR